MSKSDARAMLEALSPNMTAEELLLASMQSMIAAQISIRRQDLGLSQQQLADKLDVSQALVSRWETGDANFTLSTLVKISQALELRMQPPFELAPAMHYDDPSGKIISISRAPTWHSNASRPSSPKNYTVDIEDEAKEN